jgi:hypothetical protein
MLVFAFLSVGSTWPGSLTSESSPLVTLHYAILLRVKITGFREDVIETCHFLLGGGRRNDKFICVVD